MSDSALLHALTHRFESVSRDPVWGDIQFDEAFASLARRPEILKLDGIRQLGLVILVYPGASHTRRAHSLGVYHISRGLARSLVERGQLPASTPEGLRAFLAAALCHDIGHFPFAHSLKELPVASHETLAGDEILAEPLRSAVGACGCDPEMVASIIDGDRQAPDDEVEVYRRLLSGVMDPDKIDYLTRDAFHCGVPYGVQDAEFILRRILVGERGPMIDERGEMSVEAILFSKYQMYRAVYWHPEVRAATAMVKKAVLQCLDGSLLDAEDLYGLDDAGFGALMASVGGQPAALVREALGGRLFKRLVDIPFDADNPIHRDLMDLTKRVEAEAALAMAAEAGEGDLVIDIPEPIDFEAKLEVAGRETTADFASRSILFGADNLADLSRSIRRIRVYSKPGRRESALREFAGELLS